MRQLFSLNSEFKKNVLTLMTGSTLAQAIPIGITPILARIYTPNDFGVLALYVSLFTILSVFATGRYELAIMIPKNDKEGEEIFLLSITITVIVSLIIFFIIIFFNKEITNLLKNPDISFWLYFLPLSIFLVGLYQNFNYLSNRKKKYKLMAAGKITQSSSTTISKLGIGALRFGECGLIIGTLIGQLAGALTFAKHFFINRQGLNITKTVDIKNLLRVGKIYIEHPKYLIFSHGLLNIYMQIPVFFINKVFSISTLGFYSMAHKLISLPGNLIATSIGDVFRQKATDDYHKTGNFKQILIKTFLSTFLLSIIPFILSYFYVEEIFSFVLGEKWRIAGQYAQIMLIGSFFSFVVTPVDKAALIVNNISYILKWHVTKFFATIILVICSYYFNFGIKFFLYGLVLINALSHIIDLFMDYKFSKGEQNVRQ